MRKGCVAFLGLALIGVVLASCGRGFREQRAAWRDEAEAACLARGEVRTSAYVSLRGSPIQGAGSCGMEQPLRVNAFAAGQIGVAATQTLACPIVSTTDRFLEKVVQPAAMGVLGSQIIEMKAGSYSCRAMNNGTGTARRSEHSFGNALDIFAFRTADGREITVKNGWRGSPQEQDFLREVFVGACSHYKTVLGPGADMFHYDHFHVDLARHAGGRSICRPVIKFTPRRDQIPYDPARNWNAQQQMPADEPRSSIARSQPQAVPPSASALARADAGAGAGSGAGFGSAQSGGPIRLPGSGHFTEELVLGDPDGEGIDPDNDPFAPEDPRKPQSSVAPVRALPVPAGRQSYRPPAAASLQPQERFAPEARPPEPPPQRPWPPRF
jgi:hypothetical protein